MVGREMRGKSHRDLPCFQLEKTLHLTRFCKWHAANLFQPSAIKINSDVSELDSTVQNSVIANEAIIKSTCTSMIMKLRTKIMIEKVAQEMINLLDKIWLFVALIYFDDAFCSHCLQPQLHPISNTCTLYMIFCSKD